MRRYFCLVLLFILSAALLIARPSFSEEREVIEAPLSPAYLEWLERYNSGDVTPGGHIPFPADLSHLADNPPNESLLYPGGKNRAGEIPSKYDLRDVDGKSYVTSIKNQNPHGACWAFAAIGAMESNYLMQGGPELDLSEMHLAYFAYYNSDKSKAFDNMTNSSVAKILDEGGNSLLPTALYSRLDGPVPESELAYPTGDKNPSKPTSSTPDSYTRVLRLRDVYYLSFAAETINVNTDNTQRNIVKRRIMENGSVVANYFDDDNYYNYKSDETAYYYNKATIETNHAIQIVGWDDSYSRTNFKTNPGMDGAWLIKNSWGTTWGTDGYFWMSYANYLNEGSAFIVEESNPDMKAYYYDPLGWTGGRRGWNSSSVYMANSFKATRDDESLIEVGFYTTDNNQTCKISVYTDQGASMPSSPTNGTNVIYEQEFTHPYAGYHTVTLNSVPLTKGQYFSVIVKYEGTGMAPLSSQTNMSDNYKFQAGSFFSNDGSSWTSGSSWTANAPLKAFTILSTSTSKPTITSAAKLNDATKGYPYTTTLTAIGASPITWSLIDGALPDGLSLDESGKISGTPTTSGDYTFTVMASNDIGSDNKTIKLTVTDIPTILTTSVTGYLGYSMNEQLELSTGTSATWSMSSTLPKELKKITLSSSGVITGKPTKKGTYTVQVSAVTLAGTSTATITFNIEPKPTKAAIKTSKLQAITAGESVNETLKTSGTEPVTFALKSELSDLPDGLEFNEATGTFSGTPSVCGTYTIQVAASNIYNTLSGKAPSVKKIKLVIKGITPVITTNSLADGIKNEEYDSVAVQLSAGTLPIKWKASGLPKGLTISETGVIAGTPTKSGKFNVKLTAKNNGGTGKTDKIPMIVYETPVIKTTSLKKATANKSYSVKLSIKNNPTDVTVQGLPDTLKFNIDSKGNYLITGTPTEAGTYSVTITAENPAGSTSSKPSLTVKGVKQKSAAPSVSITNQTLETTYTLGVVGTVPPEQKDEVLTFGEARSEADITSGQRAVLDDEGYRVIAVLPQIVATDSGLYDLTVELDDDAEAGEEMFWLAFPKNADESEDDTIVEFYDEDGAEIYGVPESHLVNVSVWLNEGVIYEPVIAVKK